MENVNTCIALSTGESSQFSTSLALRTGVGLMPLGKLSHNFWADEGHPRQDRVGGSYDDAFA